MSQDVFLKQNRIRYVGLFDLDVLITTIMSWGKGEGFIMAEVVDKFKLTSDGETHEIALKGARDSSEILRYEFNVKIKATHCKQVDITKDGKSVKAMHGRIYIWIAPNLVLDQNNKFEGGSFISILKKLYFGIVYKERMENYWDEYYYDMRNLEKAIRSALQFQTSG